MTFAAVFMYICLIGAAFIAAFLGIDAWIAHRRNAVSFNVIGLSKERRTVDLQERNEQIEHDRADAVLALYVRERQLAKARQREREVLSEREVDDVFRKQAG